MKLKAGVKYIIRFEINNKILLYTATIIEDNGMLIYFKDKNNKEFTYNKNKLLSAEEVRYNG